MAQGSEVALQRSHRDLRVDFFRGLALWWIFTDHVPGDVLGDFSLRNFTLCDATELFVFLAGYAGGIAYGGTLRRQGWLYAAADAARRAWTLYVAHIFLFVVFSAQVAYSAAALSRADYLDEIHLDVIGNNPYRALFEALTLHFQPAYLNILPLYILMLLGLAVVLPLLRFPLLLGAASFSCYAFVRLTGWNLGSWTGGGWFFNPLAWQVLFVLGALISYNKLSFSAFGARWPRLALDVLAILTLLSGVWIIAFWTHPHWAHYLPPPVVATFYNVDKGGLHPLRLTSFLALIWLARRLVSPQVNWVRSRWARPLVVAGQHSLPVFCFGIFAAFVGRVAMEHDDGLLMQLAVNGVGATSMAGVGALAAWYKRKERQGRPADAAWSTTEKQPGALEVATSPPPGAALPPEIKSVPLPTQI
jgi:hypothetical protein